MLKSKIESQYEKHDCQRISQGDILRDISVIIIDENGSIVSLDYQYGVVLSQDCDLEQGNGIITASPNNKDCLTEFNQFLHSILFVPAFPSDTLRAGKHLEKMYQIKAQKFNSALWKPITKNQNPRYHFLPSQPEDQIPELVLDFKAYYTLPFKYLLSKHKGHYLATVNELFREDLSQRFSNYLNRIGLPEISDHQKEQ